MSLNEANMASGTLGNVLAMVVDGLNRHRVGLLAALDLNLGDAVSTHIGLAGGIREANLVPATMLATGGEPAWLAVKFGVAAAVILAISLLGRRYPRLWHAVTVTNVVLLAAVVSNAIQIVAL